jgi:8-oxo-dGTP diphosphatase
VVELQRDWVDEARASYAADYPAVTVEERTTEVSAETFRGYVEADEPYRGSAYAWVVREPGDAAPLSESAVVEHDDRRRVLLHYPRSSDEWGLPGGGLEAGEGHEAAVVREVAEETGVEVTVDDPWLVVHRRWVSADAPETDISHSLHVFFDATYDGGHISVQPGESNGAAWFAVPPRRLQSNAQRRAESWSPAPTER